MEQHLVIQLIPAISQCSAASLENKTNGTLEIYFCSTSTLSLICHPMMNTIKAIFKLELLQLTLTTLFIHNTRVKINLLLTILLFRCLHHHFPYQLHLNIQTDRHRLLLQLITMVILFQVKAGSSKI